MGPQVSGPLLPCLSAFPGRLWPSVCPWKLQPSISHPARDSQPGKTSFPGTAGKLPEWRLFGLPQVTCPTQSQSSWPRGWKMLFDQVSITCQPYHHGEGQPHQTAHTTGSENTPGHKWSAGVQAGKRADVQCMRSSMCKRIVSSGVLTQRGPGSQC